MTDSEESDVRAELREFQRQWNEAQEKRVRDFWTSFRWVVGLGASLLVSFVLWAWYVTAGAGDGREAILQGRCAGEGGCAELPVGRGAAGDGRFADRLWGSAVHPGGSVPADRQVAGCHSGRTWAASARAEKVSAVALKPIRRLGDRGGRIAEVGGHRPDPSRLIDVRRMRDDEG